MDRTGSNCNSYDCIGEVSGSYYMRYLNWTYGEALSYDDNVEPRPISYCKCLCTGSNILVSQNEMQWYCYYLKWVQGYNLSCEAS